MSCHSQNIVPKFYSKSYNTHFQKNALQFLISVNESQTQAHYNFVQTLKESKKFNENMWVPITNKLNGLNEFLIQGQIFRTGKVVFEVFDILNEIQIGEETHKIEKLFKSTELWLLNQSYAQANLKKVVSVYIDQREEIPFHICRFCRQDDRNSLAIAKDFCACAGFVHIECLFDEMAKKVTLVKNNNIYFYDLSAFVCRDCGNKLKPVFRAQEENFWLINLQLPISTLVCLLFLYQVDSDEISGLILIDFGRQLQKSLSIGTEYECDILLSDKSVSKEHALLVEKQNKIYLVNTSANYGCLKKLDSKVDLTTILNHQIVCNSFLFIFHMNKNHQKCKCFDRIKEYKENPLDDIQQLREESSLKKEPSEAATVTENKNNANSNPENNFFS